MGAIHLANYVHELVTAGYLDKEFYLGHAFKPIDVIADGGHPGPKAHDNFACEVDEWMSKNMRNRLIIKFMLILIFQEIRASIYLARVSG